MPRGSKRTSTPRLLVLAGIVGCAPAAQPTEEPRPVTPALSAPPAPKPVEAAPTAVVPKDPCDDGDTRACAQLGPWATAGAARGGAKIAIGATDKLEIAKALCESPPVARGAGFTCDCPSYTELSAEGQHRGSFEIGPFFPGHFSGPGRHEVVVQTKGCESGAGSGQTYGAKALVRRGPDGWERSFYQRGALGTCTAILSPAGRSRLVCHRVSGHQGIYPVEILLVELDEKRGEVGVNEAAFFTFDRYDIRYLRGLGEKGPLPAASLARYEIVGQKAYEAGDGRAFSVELTVESRVDCVGGPKGCPGVDTSAWSTKLRYAFDGSTFAPAPESAAASQRLLQRLALGHP